MSGSELTAPVRTAYLRLLEQRFGLRPARQPGEAHHLDGVVTELLATSSYTQPADLYVALAAGSLPQLLEALGTSMTVGETYFFRVTPQIEALRRTVLPDLIARHATDRRLRVWSAGCSTGEEAYTVAMLLCEQISDLEKQGWDIQLVATDLNRAALDVARLGVYGAWSFRESPPDLRARYFSPTAKRWRLNDQVRSMVRFVQHNLAEDPVPFASGGQAIDLIVCRNVTIYFGARAVQSLYDRFATALDPAGWLLLGPSDPVPTAASGLEVTTLDGALVWRRRPVAKLVPISQHARAPAKHAATASARRPGLAKRPSTPRPVERRTPATTSMDPLVYLRAGLVKLGEAAPAAAIDSLRRAAFLDETSALIQFSLGTAYRQMGDASRSRSAFAQARRLLAGQADDLPLAGGDAVTGDLRQAVEAQLADLDRKRA